MVDRRLVSLAALAVAGALALAGCGGGDDDSSAESWAGDVCTELNTWIDDVDETVSSLTDEGLGVDQADIEAAVGDISSATDDLVSGLDELGPPDVEDGEQAQSELDELGAQLRGEVEDVREASEDGGGVLAIAQTVGASLSTAAAAVQSTFETLRDLDPAGELRDGFENADSCDSLQEQLRDIGSE